MLCTTVVHNDTHTDVSSSCSSLGWVLSYWVHFTVGRFICVCVLFCFVLYCICCISRTKGRKTVVIVVVVVVLAYCEHGGVDPVGLKPSP